MDTTATGPVATEMLKRLNSALSPSRIELTDESELFTGKSRVERQRLVYRALGKLMHERVHALSIRATAPGE